MWSAASLAPSKVSPGIADCRGGRAVSALAMRAGVSSSRQTTVAMPSACSRSARMRCSPEGPTRGTTTVGQAVTRASATEL